MQIDGLMASMLGSIGSNGGGSGGGSPEAAEAALSSLASGAASTGGGGGGIPQALHNLQRLLQSQLASMNPLQLQQVLQRQQQQQMADAGRKQLEQMHQQIQEQLQINLLQQSHMGSGKGGGGSNNNAAALQQLQQQQQQLVAQMQMTQQALVLGQGLDGTGGGGGSGGGGSNSSKEQLNSNGSSSGSPGSSPAMAAVDPVRSRLRHASETHGSTGSEGSFKENSRPHVTEQQNNNLGISMLPKSLELNGGRHRHQSQFHAAVPVPLLPNTAKLYSHGHCCWPGCDCSCPDVSAFQRHLSTAHVLDDKSTAQTRVQVQIVTQLELQLNKERDKLDAMMAHLRLDNRNGELVPRTSSFERRRSRSPSPKRFKRDPSSPPPPPFPPTMTSPTAAQQSPLSALTAAVRSPLLSGGGGGGHVSTSTAQLASIRPRSSAGTPLEKTLLSGTPSSGMGAGSGISLPPGYDERRGRGDRGNPNLDPEMDLKMNKEFYMHNDVRPPYTYAALIRYAVQDSPDQQLTLHEIYNWFTTSFAYFRRNAASWKNAVRHNLSLHKCFMRVENVKGAVWTVDDDEYHRRRPPRGVQSSSNNSATASPTLTPQAPSLIDQNLSSMLAAAAAAAAATGQAGGPGGKLEAMMAAATGQAAGSPAGAGGMASFFNQAALMEHAAAAAAAAAAAQAQQHQQQQRTRRPSFSGGLSPPRGAAFPDLRAGLESPPASLDNRSTPGSLDLSRLSKGGGGVGGVGVGGIDGGAAGVSPPLKDDIEDDDGGGALEEDEVEKFEEGSEKADRRDDIVEGEEDDGRDVAADVEPAQDLSKSGDHPEVSRPDSPMEEEAKGE